MIEERLTIRSFEFVDGADDTADDARTRYKSVFPGRSARRMTHLGMMVGVCLRELEVRKNVPIVYASEFGESASLEKFIDSFPQASPALFQSSIHPSAVEQFLVPGKQAVDRFYPIASDSNLLGQALENCFLLNEEEVVLVGGEERGTWLCDCDFASRKSFAFGFNLDRKCGGIGSMEIERGKPPVLEARFSLTAIADALKRREPIRVPSFALNAWIRIEWR